MPNLATATIIGHLGRDPDVRYSQSGSPIANMSVAVTTRKGETEHTMWWKVSLFGKQAEIAEKYLHKGDAALFQGRIRIDTYKDKQGETREALCLDANGVTLLGGGKRAEGQQSAPAAPSRSPKPSGPPGVEYDDEIPFN